MITTPPRFSGIVRAAAAALALALVPTLSAAQTAPAKKKPAPAKATAPDPAPAPAPAPAARASSTSLPYGITFGIGPSFEGSTALKLRLEGSMTMRPLFPNTTFELALPIGLAFWGQSGAVPGFYTWDISYVRFEIVPTARISAPVARDLGLYGDVGLGFDYASVSITTTPSFFTYSASSGAGGIFKLAGGGYYSLDPHWRLFLEPIGLNFYFGGVSGFVYTIMLGAGYHFG
jgi:hypothetical protein